MYKSEFPPSAFTTDTPLCLNLSARATSNTSVEYSSRPRATFQEWQTLTSFDRAYGAAPLRLMLYHTPHENIDAFVSMIHRFIDQSNDHTLFLASLFHTDRNNNVLFSSNRLTPDDTISVVASSDEGQNFLAEVYRAISLLPEQDIPYFGMIRLFISQLPCLLTFRNCSITPNLEAVIAEQQTQLEFLPTLPVEINLTPPIEQRTKLCKMAERNFGKDVQRVQHVYLFKDNQPVAIVKNRDEYALVTLVDCKTTNGILLPAGTIFKPADVDLAERHFRLFSEGAHNPHILPNICLDIDELTVLLKNDSSVMVWVPNRMWCLYTFGENFSTIEFNPTVSDLQGEALMARNGS